MIYIDADVRRAGWQWLVAHSDSIVKGLTKVFGKTLLVRIAIGWLRRDGAQAVVLKPTFFGHFCAGEDEATIRPTVEYLRCHGVGSILARAPPTCPPSDRA